MTDAEAVDLSRLQPEDLAQAWDEGHKAPRRRGPDNCQCGAWSAGECACGRYGTGELLSLSANPYRPIASEVFPVVTNPGTSTTTSVIPSAETCGHMDPDGCGCDR